MNKRNCHVLQEEFINIVHNKSNISEVMNSQQSKNKNPLLSCALTGGFEDISSGIVLAAAGEFRIMKKIVQMKTPCLVKYFNQCLYLFISFCTQSIIIIFINNITLFNPTFIWESEIKWKLGRKKENKLNLTKQF